MRDGGYYVVVDAVSGDVLGAGKTPWKAWNSVPWDKRYSEVSHKLMWRVPVRQKPGKSSIARLVDAYSELSQLKFDLADARKVLLDNAGKLEAAKTREFADAATIARLEAELKTAKAEGQ